ncbi:MAG TPA: phosphatase PAP2 family protein [Rhizomicrobium sp.]
MEALGVQTESGPMHYVRAIACVVLFIVLAVLVLAGLTVPFDTAARTSLHGWASPHLTQLALLLSFIGSAWIWAPATAVVSVLLFVTAQRKAAVAMLACMAGAVVLDNALKLLFHRPRPLGFFAADPRTYSFPSGHALFAACFYGALAIVLAGSIRSAAARTALWITAVVAILCIGWSRIYLGVHYPSDVLAGYLAGAAWVQFLRAAGPLYLPRANADILAP